MKKIIVSMITALIVVFCSVFLESISDYLKYIIDNFGNFQNLLFMLLPFIMLAAAVKEKNSLKKDSDGLTPYQREFEREMVKIIKEAKKEKSK